MDESASFLITSFLYVNMDYVFLNGKFGESYDKLYINYDEDG